VIPVLPDAELTGSVSVQDRPPMFSIKLAVPEPLGIPVIVYTRLPLPLANVPADSVAVRPLTPDEVAAWPLWLPPFPPL
jgi:hypothetical protein